MNDGYTIPYGKNTYCGPAALAYALRTDPDHAAKLLRAITGSRAIRGVKNSQLFTALYLHGATPLVVHRTAPNSFCPMLKEFAFLHPSGEYVVYITEHYVVLHNGMLFDNRYHLGKPLTETPYMRCRVIMAWKVNEP